MIWYSDSPFQTAKATCPSQRLSLLSMILGSQGPGTWLWGLSLLCKIWCPEGIYRALLLCCLILFWLA